VNHETDDAFSMVVDRGQDDSEWWWWIVPPGVMGGLTMDLSDLSTAKLLELLGLVLVLLVGVALTWRAER